MPYHGGKSPIPSPPMSPASTSPIPSPPPEPIPSHTSHWKDYGARGWRREKDSEGEGKSLKPKPIPFHQKRHMKLHQMHTASHQKHTASQQKHTASHQIHTASQQNHTASQQNPTALPHNPHNSVVSDFQSENILGKYDTMKSAIWKERFQLQKEKNARGFMNNKKEYLKQLEFQEQKYKENTSRILAEQESLFQLRVGTMKEKHQQQLQKATKLAEAMGLTLSQLELRGALLVMFFYVSRRIRTEKWRVWNKWECYMIKLEEKNMELKLANVRENEANRTAVHQTLMKVSLKNMRNSHHKRQEAEMRACMFYMNF